MTLTEKGPIRPVPSLSALLEPISQAVQRWPGVSAFVHWDLYRVGEKVDGADFYVDGEEQELGHLHLDGDLHLPLPHALRDSLLAAGLARPFPYGTTDEVGWVAYHVRSAADARQVEWLFRLNYDFLRGTPLTELLTRVAEWVG